METQRYKWYSTFLLPWQCAPFYATMRVVLMLVRRAVPAVQIFATASFIDGSLAFLQGTGRWEELIAPVLVLAGIIVVNNLGVVADNLLKQLMGNGIRTKFVDYLTVKCAKLPYGEVENHETWDLIGRVKSQPDTRVERGFDSLLNLAGMTIQAASFLVVLCTQVWWSLPIVAAAGAVVIRFALRGGEEQYGAEKDVAENKRRYEYYGKLMTGREMVDERNLFRFFPMLQKLWKENYDRTRGAERRVVVRYLVRIKLVSSAMAGVTFLIAALLFFPLSAGTLSAGLYISLIQAANGVVDLMSWELSDYFSMYAKYREYVRDVAAFSALKEVEGALELPAKDALAVQEIEFRDVSFAYPGTDRLILDKVNVTIKAGRHYAMVGGNGAGKTTVIKLLTGLYPEFTGEILINGSPIRSFSAPQRKAMLAVLFQDFARYEISALDNVAMGNLRQRGTEAQRREIQEALGLLGLEGRARTLKKGLDTRLGKLMEGGENLSGGEWQRLAMARVVVSPAGLLVLDEPTAALDPISESRLYEEFGRISRGRTAVFISHRLGSTMLADEIIVLDQGRVAAQGSHEDLMAGCPLYRKMYESQRSWYTEGTP